MVQLSRCMPGRHSVEVEELLHSFLTSSLYGGEGSSSHPRRFTRAEKVPGTHWTHWWVGPVTFWGRENIYTCPWCVCIHLKYTATFWGRENLYTRRWCVYIHLKRTAKFWRRENLHTCRWCVYIHLEHTGCNEIWRSWVASWLIMRQSL